MTALEQAWDKSTVKRYGDWVRIPMADFEAIQVSICDMFQKESDAREGMVPAAELRPTIEALKSISLCGWPNAAADAAAKTAKEELTRLETLLGEKESK